MTLTVPCGAATLVCGGDQSDKNNFWLVDGEILLGLRKGAHGAGMWSLPGGRVEPGEPPELTARREVREETGIYLGSVRLFQPCPFNNTLAGGQHWVTLFFQAWIESAEPRLLEPKKCDKWEWFPMSHLPSPLFEPFAELWRETRHWMIAEYRRMHG